MVVEINSSGGGEGNVMAVVVMQDLCGGDVGSRLM